MKRCLCCFNPATHISHNSVLRLCDDCYESMKSDYESQFEQETNLSFEDFYEFEEIEENVK